MAAPMPPDESRGPAIITIGWVCVAISTVFVGCRLFTRIRITRNSGIDDILMAFSVILLACSVSLTTVAVNYGLGRHLVYLDRDQISHILELTAILQPIGIFSYIFPKFAVVLLISKIVGPKRDGVWFLYFLLVILVSSSVIPAILLFVRCNPHSHYKKPWLPAHCWSPNVLKDTSIFGGSWSAFVDFCLSLFPIKVFWNLQMKRSRKIVLSILMGLGILATVCAIIKTTYLSSGEATDFTWEFEGLAICTFIESAVVMICACIPTLPKFVLLLLGKRERPTYEPSARPVKPSYPVTGSISNLKYKQSGNSNSTSIGESEDDLVLQNLQVGNGEWETV